MSLRTTSPDAHPWTDEFLRQERLPPEYRRTIAAIHVPLAARIGRRSAESGGRVLTVGLCGPQGSGKSTLARSLGTLLETAGVPTAILALDDLYLTRDERSALARRVHPLLQTRGVPGTHDVSLGRDVLGGLRERAPVAIPSFDKSRDDRRPRERWPVVRSPVQVVLFEGWCVGARPQSAAALADPINELERTEDPEGLWRRYVNDQLAGPYGPLFAAIDLLVLLEVPDFDDVFGWRLEQERKLEARVLAEGGDLSRVMSAAQVRRFIGHYERLTRHIQQEMPARAAIVLPARGVA
jgi:D-glycerate 3-kinase